MRGLPRQGLSRRSRHREGVDGAKGLEPRWEMRPLSKEDLPELVALAQRQGRNVHAGEYERFLGLEGAQGLVLRRDGEIAGAVTAMRYFDSGFLGPLLMMDGADATGLSLVMLSYTVEGLQKGGVGMMEAEAAEGEAMLLERMGWRRVRRTLVLERPATPASGAEPRTLPMEPHHLLDVGAMDASVRDWGRKEYLLALRDEHPRGARVVESEGEAAGYVLVRRSRRGYHLGPLVTREGDLDAARRLLADALESVAGWPAVVMVPEDSGLLESLDEAGFGRVGDLVRMRAGAPGREPEGPAVPATEWVVGGRLTG